MDFADLARRGLVMLGCGKMGSAMLSGWLARGLPAAAVHVIDPNPSNWLRDQGVSLGADLPKNPALVLLAVKPQIMQAALPQVAGYAGGGTVFLSVAAGITLARFEQSLGSATPIIRSIPNTPAAVGKGITALIGNTAVSEPDLVLAETLLSAIGQTVRLEHEEQMDAVTGVSGSGPAYVFHMIEALASAAEAQGLPAAMAMHLAKATVAGAGALAETAEETPAQLRVNVTSPNGTTQAGLEVLMDATQGLTPLMTQTVTAATRRSQELGRD